MTKISIIIPVHNVEKYLDRCLSSVVNQIEKDIEIIVVNDCSTDNSEAIILEYVAKDPRIKYVKHKTHKHLGGSRNTGLAESTGEFIWFVDSDDWVDSSACELLYNTAKLENLDVLTFNCSIVKEHQGGKYLHEGLGNISKEGSIQIFDGLSFLSRELELSNNWLWHSACRSLFRRDLIVSQNIKFVEGYPGEDDLWSLLMMYNAGRIKQISDSLYFYFRHDNSILYKYENEDNLPYQMGYLKGLIYCFEYCLTNKIYDGVLLKILAKSYYRVYSNYFDYQFTEPNSKDLFENLLTSLEARLVELLENSLYLRMKFWVIKADLVYRKKQKNKLVAQAKN